MRGPINFEDGVDAELIDGFGNGKMASGLPQTLPAFDMEKVPEWEGDGDMQGHSLEDIKNKIIAIRDVEGVKVS